MSSALWIETNVLGAVREDVLPSKSSPMCLPSPIAVLLHNPWHDRKQKEKKSTREENRVTFSHCRNIMHKKIYLLISEAWPQLTSSFEGTPWLMLERNTPKHTRTPTCVPVTELLWYVWPLGTLAAIITIPRKRKQTVRRRQSGNNPPTPRNLSTFIPTAAALAVRCSAKRSSRPSGGGVCDSSCCVSVCVEGRKSSRHNFFFALLHFLASPHQRNVS